MEAAEPVPQDNKSIPCSGQTQLETGNYFAAAVMADELPRQEFELALNSNDAASMYALSFLTGGRGRNDQNKPHLI
jgi:hypothetical protein